MSTNELYKTLDLPGIKIFKSVISNQYFTGLKIEDTPESVANVTKFTHPDLTTDEYKKIRNSEVSHSLDKKHVDFYMAGNRLQSIRIGSYVMRNMYGTLLIVTEQNFKDTFIKVEDGVKDDLLLHYFFITISLFITAPDGRIITTLSSCDVSTYQIWPSKKNIIDHCLNNMDSIKNLKESGCSVTIDIVNIQELTKEQIDAFHFETK